MHNPFKFKSFFKKKHLALFLGAFYQTRVENLQKGPVFSNINHKSLRKICLFEENASMKFKENVCISGT